MTTWTLFTNHCRVLSSIANDPEARLREIAAGLGITERRAYGIVNDLVAGGYVTKHRDGRRNRYEVHTDVAILDVLGNEQPVGEMLRILTGRA